MGKRDQIRSVARALKMLIRDEAREMIEFTSEEKMKWISKVIPSMQDLLSRDSRDDIFNI